MLEIKTQIEEKIKDSFDLFSLPLKSQFRYFQFNGLADGTLLIPNFSLADIQGKTVVIKSIKIVPYYPPGLNIYQDFYLTDGVTTNEELIGGSVRINRLFDDYGTGCILSLILNGSSIPMFPTNAPIVPPFVDGNCTLDLDIDNIFFKYNAKLISFDVSVNALIVSDLENNTTVNPQVKVFVGCYLI